MAERKVAIRFGTEGRAAVVADLDAIGASGDAAAKRYGRAFDKASDDAEAAIARQKAAMERLAALMPKTGVQMQVEAAAGSNTRFGGGYAADAATRLGQWESSAKASAQAFSDLFAEQERLERGALALRAAIDPAFAAQQRFDREIAEARTLLAGGAISLDDYAKRAWQLQQGLGVVDHATKRSGSAFAAAAPQIQDFFTQVTMGANPIQVLSVQGGQLAGQLIYLEGTAGNVARFFMSGWGVAFQVALMVLAPFVTKLLESGEASKAAEKAAAAHRQAILDLQAAQERAIQTADRKQAIDVANLKIALDQVIATRKQTQALLEQALAQERVDRQRYSGTGQRGELGSLAAAESSSRAAGLETLLATNTTELKAAQRGFDLGFARLLGMKVDDRSTPEGAATARYNRAREEAFNTLAADATKLAARLRELNVSHERELKAIHDETAARNKNTLQFGREVTSSQAAAIARAAGFQVNSGDRSTARQTELYNAWVAAGRPANNPVAKPGTSAHEHGNALDIQMAAGVTVAKIKDAFAAEGVRLTKIITEKGHWHVEWARTAGEKQADAEMTKDARDAAAAQRQLKSDIEAVIKVLDPARAAGDGYATTLLTIAKAQQAGMLSAGEAMQYTVEAASAEAARQAKDLEDRAKNLLGISGDPLADMLDRGKQGQQADSDAWYAEFERRGDLQRGQVQSLANFYQQVFNGGTGSIWNMFRQRGLQVLSELLAKWTMGQGGGGGGLLSLLGLAKGGSDALSNLRMAQYADLPITAPALPGFATGTEYASGGLALVGERGRELVSLPRGSRVTPASETRRLLAGNDNVRGETHNHYYIEGNLMTPEFWDRINAGDELAAVRGAAGGSTMGQAEATAAGARRLGRKW